MHESFQKLDETVNENGKTLNQYDMVQAVPDMAARNDQLDMKRITKDLKAIKAENDDLQAKYAKAKAAEKGKGSSQISGADAVKQYKSYLRRSDAS